MILPLVLALLGCGSKVIPPILSNHRPIVRLTAGPVDTSEVASYSITFTWVGYDVDGRIDHYLYAVDPPSGSGADTLWVKTTENEKMLVFSASTPDPQDPFHRSRDPHVFVIKAVDDRRSAGPSVF